MVQYDDDLKGLSFILMDRYDHEWNYIGYSQIAINFFSQDVSLFNPQSHSNPESHSSLIRHYAGYAVSSSFGQSSDIDLSLITIDAECQFLINNQSFQQNLLF